ncbi:MAG: glycoside hydrolase family 13 protein [Muribaculaceae bacterium]|nr:glycoside hydrolase family 13 protein [Roseburia sp.]MCM1432141.1 glycoside hydrolase family 13 protein [Muribaculaceae bacterium]MCM1493640.1 glycoside hydrolase family 13 protein [Muribaculaceae bacterium]MCM1560193.1 glycoside hydrolase family 13 protein [Butyrivibrio sp.]
MNEYAMLHVPDSRYCFPVGERELVVRLRLSREDRGVTVSLLYNCKYVFQQQQESLLMEVKYSDRLYDYYEARLVLADVRFAYIFAIQEGGKIYYYSEDGLTESYCFAEGFYNFFQMPYINKNDVMPVVDWMRRAVFYQIFVERFALGDRKKDLSYINMEWGNRPEPKSFAGGDLKGILEKLDYLAALGVNALYLTPVFDSISNHKYDIRDYKEIDPRFGTKEDFKALVEGAHARGMRIVLDAVFNHCSMQLAQFQDVMKNGRNSPWFDWFFIRGDFPDPEQMNYECFAACSYMPKLNTANPQAQEFLLDIACYWIREFDIDGWRLDVSDEVSHEFWRRFRHAVKEVKPDCVIIGENWHDAYPYLRGDQYDSIMNYSFTKACLDYFAKERFDAQQMADKLNANLMRNSEPVNYMMLNLLDSHDTHRFFTEVGKDKEKLLAALALEMLLPGAPCIYYGTEICMEGGYDPDSRRCFDWEEADWDRRVMDKIKELAALRRLLALQYGEVRILAEKDMLCVTRRQEAQEVRLYINLSGTKRTPKADGAEVLCSNLWKEGALAHGGFLVVESVGEREGE